MITFTPSTKAHAQVYDTPTFLFVTASPDPVGVGQIVYVGITFSKPTPTGAGYSGDLYEGITLDVTDPSGHKSTFGPYYASPVAGVIYSFTPDMVGNYTMQAHYPGQVLKGYNRDNPTISSSSRNLIGSKMLPSESNIKTLIVQQDPVTAKYVTPPLPTEYWVRPVYGLNWWWGASIASNWFGLGGQGGYEASGNVSASRWYSTKLCPYCVDESSPMGRPTRISNRQRFIHFLQFGLANSIVLSPNLYPQRSTLLQ